MSKISVTALWDAEHKVWYATSEDIAGLHVETETYEELLEVVPSLVSDLLELNGGGPADMVEVPLEILTHYQSSVRLNQQ